MKKGINNKIPWIENLKGLTMLAVVLGHIATPLTNFIFSWHMPAFFFLSGFFINVGRPTNKSIKKDARRLILPFIVFGILGLVAEVVKRKLFSGFEFAVKDFELAKEIQGLFFWMDFTHMHQYGFVLWFLPALFWGKTILQLLLKIIGSKILIGSICLALFFVFANRDFILPFSIDKGLFSLVWLLGGFLYYNYYIKEAQFKLGICFATIIIAATILIIAPVQQINVAVKIVQNPLLGLAYSFSIIFLLIAIFRNFGDRYLNNIFLENFGKNSLIILVLHPYTNNVGYVIAGEFFNGNWGVIFITSVLLLIGLLLIVEYVERSFKNSHFAYRFQSTRIN